MSAFFKLTFVVWSIIILAPVDGFAHGGGLDSSGGHYNRRTGEYHYHRQPAAKTILPSRPSTEFTVSHSRATSSPRSTTPAISPSERSQKINAYFRNANENVGALSCGVVIHERNLDSATKRAVRNRDGNRCVICGSTMKLEVDHIRGLQNGGSNDASNLATLCDDCHTEKTRMDSSLRRKRDKICR